MMSLWAPSVGQVDAFIGQLPHGIVLSHPSCCGGHFDRLLVIAMV